MTELLKDQETPSLLDVLRTAMDSVSDELRVCLPGKIVAYDINTHLASVQPLLKRPQFGRDAASLPVITRVPVVHPRTAKAMIRLPVSTGDLCLLVFADYALENWLGGIGAEADPLDTRVHNVSDAVAIIGGYPELAPPINNYPDALEISVQPGTKVAVTNGTVELLDLIDQILDQIQANTDAIKDHYHIGFAGAPTTGPDPTTLGLIEGTTSLIEAIKSSLGAIKA